MFILKVSVVVPLFNCERFLTDCLESIFNQTYTPSEIIVIDDGSTDASLSVLDAFKSALPSRNLELLKVFHTHNLGAASARNRGILEAKGDLIAFVDADDIWSTNKLSLQVAEIELRGVDFVCAPGLYLRNGTVEEATPRINLTNLKKSFVTSFGINPILPSGLIIKKCAMAKTGLFDTALKGPSEDYDFNRRVIRELSGAVITQPLFYYRIHDSNVSGRNVGKIKRDYRLALTKQCADDRTSTFRRAYLKFQLELRFFKRGIREKINTLNSIKLSAKTKKHNF